MANLAEHQRALRKVNTQARTTTARYAPHAVKVAFVDGNYDAALAGLKRAIEGSGVRCGHCNQYGAPEPWALRAWLEAAGAVGAMSQVVVNLHASMGVRNEDELRALVESGRRLERMNDGQISDEEYFDAAYDLMRNLLRKRPEWREKLHALTSGAEVVGVNTNGGP